MTKADMQDEIDRLLQVVEEQDQEITDLRAEGNRLEDRIEEVERSLEDAQDAQADAEAKLEEPPEAVAQAFRKIMSGIREVLPEGEDIENESVGLYNLRRGLEDLWTALDSKEKNRWPWVRASEGSI
jgi:chromosome segregation ATPase